MQKLKVSIQTFNCLSSSISLEFNNDKAVRCLRYIEKLRLVLPFTPFVCPKRRERSSVDSVDDNDKLKDKVSGVKDEFSEQCIYLYF